MRQRARPIASHSLIESPADVTAATAGTAATSAAVSRVTATAAASQSPPRPHGTSRNTVHHRTGKKLSHKEIIAQRIRNGGKFVEKKQPWTNRMIDKHKSALERETREQIAAKEKAEQTV